jgi:Chemotaxis phosphatase CheX
MVTIRCTAGAAADLATRMMGPDANVSDDSPKIDALGELCNMVAGNFKAKIQLADRCMLSVTTVIRGAIYEMQGSAESRVSSGSQSRLGFDLRSSCRSRRLETGNSNDNLCYWFRTRPSSCVLNPSPFC